MYNDKELLLILNCVDNTVQIVLAYINEAEQQVLYASQWNSGNQGVEKLAPAIEFAFEQSSLEIEQLSKIAVVRGPGSFTGIRLGLTTASALRRSTNAQLAGLLLQDCLAHSAKECLANDSFLAVLSHARNNLTYLSVFKRDNNNNDLKAISITSNNLTNSNITNNNDKLNIILPEILTPDLALQHLQNLSRTKNQTLTLLGSSLIKHKQLFLDGLENITILTQNYSLPKAEALVALACKAEYQNIDLEPLYLRASDAEDNLSHIAKKLGLNPAEAQLSLEHLTSTVEHIQKES